MTEAAKEARKKYLREWRRSNPDKVRAQKARYWERKAVEAVQAERANEGTVKADAEC